MTTFAGAGDRRLNAAAFASECSRRGFALSLATVQRGGYPFYAVKIAGRETPPPKVLDTIRSDEIASIGRSFVRFTPNQIQRGYLDTLCPDWERGTVWTVTGATCCGTRYSAPEAPHTGAASRNGS